MFLDLIKSFCFRQHGCIRRKVVSSLKSLFKKCGLFLTRDILPATHKNLPATRDPSRFDSLAIFGLPLLLLSSSAPTLHQHLLDVAGQPGLILSSSFVFGTDSICSDFQEALSLLVYRNLWYMDAQVCFLKFLFKTWIDHFFQISTEISSMDVWKHWSLSGLLTFSIFRLI